MTMPKTPTATAIAIAANGNTAAVAPSNGAAAAPTFAVGLPPLTQLPDPPRTPRMPIQAQNFARVLTILGDYYDDRPDVLVMGEGYLASDVNSVSGSLKPDCIIAFEMPRPKEEIDASNGYIISELGKPPDFVLEVGSESTGRRDYTIKRDVYAAQQVAEYWRFDHSGGYFHDAALAGDRLLSPGVYQRIEVTRTPEGIYRGYSAVLELELHWVGGELRFWNPATGDYVPDIATHRVQREAAETRLDTETAARRVAEAGRRMAEAARLATADQLDAALIDRDANAARAQAEAAARQAAEAQRQEAESRAQAEAAARAEAETARQEAEARAQAQADQLAAAQALIQQLQAQQQ